MAGDDLADTRHGGEQQLAVLDVVVAPEDDGVGTPAPEHVFEQLERHAGDRLEEALEPIRRAMRLKPPVPALLHGLPRLFTFRAQRLRADFLLN